MVGGQEARVKYYSVIDSGILLLLFAAHPYLAFYNIVFVCFQIVFLTMKIVFENVFTLLHCIAANTEELLRGGGCLSRLPGNT